MKKRALLLLKKVMTIFDLLLALTHYSKYLFYRLLMALDMPYILELFAKLILHNKIPTEIHGNGSVTQTHTEIWDWTEPSSQDGRTSEIVPCCLLVHSARLSSVTLPEANGLGEEKHWFHTVQVKTIDFASDTLLPIMEILQTAFKLKQWCVFITQIVMNKIQLSLIILHSAFTSRELTRKKEKTSLL